MRNEKIILEVEDTYTIMDVGIVTTVIVKLGMCHSCCNSRKC